MHAHLGSCFLLTGFRVFRSHFYVAMNIYWSQSLSVSTVEPAPSDPCKHACRADVAGMHKHVKQLVSGYAN